MPAPALRGLAPDVQRANDALASRVDDIAASPIVPGVLREDVAVGTSDTQVAHGLGRMPRGWFLVSPAADARVWQTADASATLLTLRASAAVTTSLWVF